MNALRFRCLILVLALLPGLSGSLAAAPPNGGPPGRQEPSAGQGLSQAVADIERRTGGRVLSAEKAHHEGRSAYRIKLLTREGHVRVIWLDAETQR